jgi:RimJ/RimL family protein N-acetyltransferase
MQSFTTERLLIRPLAEQDKAMYISLYTDAKIMRNIGEPLSVEAAEKAFTRTIKAMQKPKPKTMTWAIVMLAGKKSIGIQALSWQRPTFIDEQIIPNNNQADIGIMLTSEFQGQCIPAESLSILITYAFNQLGLDKITAYHSNENLKSQRVFDKLGFIFDAKIQPRNTNDCYRYFDKEK